MFREMNRQAGAVVGAGRGCMLLGLLILALLASGCTTTRGIDNAELPCDVAWRKLANDRSAWEQIGTVVKSTAFESTAARIKEQELEAQRTMTKVSPIDAYNQLTDQMAADLAEALPTAPDVAKAQNKQVLVLNLDSDPSLKENRELQFALKGVTGKLNQNAKFRSNFVVIGTSEAAADSALKAAGAGEYFEYTDPMNPTISQSAKVRYNPDTIYSVDSAFNRKFEGRTMQYYILVNVTKSRQRALLTSKTIVKEYRFQPFAQEWVSADHDEARRKRWEQTGGTSPQ